MTRTQSLAKYKKEKALYNELITQSYLKAHEYVVARTKKARPDLLCPECGCELTYRSNRIRFGMPRLDVTCPKCSFVDDILDKDEWLLKIEFMMEMDKRTNHD